MLFSFIFHPLPFINLLNSTFPAEKSPWNNFSQEKEKPPENSEGFLT